MPVAIGPDQDIADPTSRKPTLQLVLASTSPYRKALLARLGIPFLVERPDVDETRLPGEDPKDLALRLAVAKAVAVSPRFPSGLIIGSDQVALLENEILDKPGNAENAKRQLQKASGKTVVFHTALCVYDGQHRNYSTRVVPVEVRFRKLDERTIDAYLSREQPYDCAASAKAESLGIALIERITGDDPNALIGLPLIALIDLLAERGFNVL